MDPNNHEEEEGERPGALSSNITLGGDQDTRTDSNEDEGLQQEETTHYGAEDELEPHWTSEDTDSDEEAGWSGVDVVDPAKKMLSAPKDHGEDRENLVPNPGVEGAPIGSSSAHLIPLDKRVWCCSGCQTYNSMRLRGNGSWNCVNCGRIRDFEFDAVLEAIPEQRTVEPVEAPMDEAALATHIFHAWKCHCDWVNKWEWNACAFCKRPPIDDIFKVTHEMYVATEPTNPNQPDPLPFFPDVASDIPAPSAAVVNQPMNYGGNNAANHHFRQGDKKKYEYKEPQIPLPRIGVESSLESFPNMKSKPIEKPLLALTGVPYRQRYICESPKVWHRYDTLLHPMKQTFNDQICVPPFQWDVIKQRGLAIDQLSGWIATMSNCGLAVWQPINNGMDLLLFAFLQIDTAFDDTDRLRFVGNRLYVFRRNIYTIETFILDRDFHELKRDTYLLDDYLKKWNAADVEITEDFAIVLFDRWLGFYRMPRFEWHYAVAFSEKVTGLQPHSLIMNMDSSNDIDLHQYHNEAFFNLPKPAADAKHSQQKPNFMYRVFGKKEEKEEPGAEEKSEWRSGNLYSNTNFAYVSCNDELIVAHPSNPVYEYLHSATNVGKQCSFCVSKQYGTFHISADGKRLRQSAKLDYTMVTDLEHLGVAEYVDKTVFVSLYDSEMNPPFESMFNCLYDEYFGISGRLLVYGFMSDLTFAMKQFFNWKEMKSLIDEIDTVGYTMESDKKPFNLTVFVYQFLYGDYLIRDIVTNPCFNKYAAAVPKQLDGAPQTAAAAAEEEQKDAPAVEEMEGGDGYEAEEEEQDEWEYVPERVQNASITQQQFQDMLNID